MSENHFDVIIIGAGISGLTAAALLTKSGKKVCVLEKQYQIGGYLQGFQRKEYNFDTAIHWMNQFNETGTIPKLFSFIDTDFPRPQEMKTIQRHIGNHHNYVLTNNPDDLKAQLIKDFPHEKEGIERFYKAAKKIAKVSLKFSQLFQSSETKSLVGKWMYGLKQLSIIYPMIPYVFYSGQEGVTKGLNKFFKDPELHKLFCSEQDLLSCLFPTAWAYNNDYQNPPIGGSQVLPKWLSEKITQHGSVIKTSCTVQDLIVENGKFKGVNYTNRAKNYTISGDFLIAACDVTFLFSKLFPKGMVKESQIDKIAKSKLYSSSVTISLVLDCPVEEIGFGEELVFLCDDDLKIRDDHASGDPHHSFLSILAPTSRDHTMAPEGQGILTIFVPAWIEYENYWRTERKPNGDFIKTDAYKALKEEYSEIIIERIVKRLSPNLRQHILFKEIATPITYYRYTNNLGGTMMGSRPGKENMQNKVANYKTPLPNVFVGGHWAELGGGIPIAVKAAFNSSLLVLKQSDKKAFHKLANHMKK